MSKLVQGVGGTHVMLTMFSVRTRQTNSIHLTRKKAVGNQRQDWGAGDGDRGGMRSQGDEGKRTGASSGVTSGSSAPRRSPQGEEEESRSHVAHAAAADCSTASDQDTPVSVKVLRLRPSLLNAAVGEFNPAACEFKPAAAAGAAQPWLAAPSDTGGWGWVGSWLDERQRVLFPDLIDDDAFYENLTCES